MADDQEKTEEPTSKKIEDAREEGNVPKSQEIASFITLVIALSVSAAMVSLIYENIISLYIYYQNFIGTEITKSAVLNITLQTFKSLLIMVLPIATSVAIGGVIAAVIQFGFIFAPKAIEPKLSKLNPIKGIKNLISLKKFIETLKIILKVSVIFIAAFYFMKDFTEESPYTVLFQISDQLIWLRDRVILIISVILALFLVLSMIDLLFVRYNYFKDLRMSKQEVKDEFKQMDGDPQVKARIKRAQMEMSQKRMMQEIPDADVVITNPTHYAIALRYDKTKENAPVILAKGVDFLALKIKEIALKHKVQIVENPPLARELYKSCEIGNTIPESLYKAVAEVLAFVYKTNQKKR